MVYRIAFAFKGIRRCVQTAKQLTVWLSLDCINGKYLWALPTPTTFFIITVLISPIMAILIVRNCLGVIFCSMVKLKFAE